MADIIYDSFMSELAKKTHDLDSDTIKCALLKNTHTPDSNDDVWADVSGDENPAGSGYTTGGETLSNVTITESGVEIIVDADDPLWTSLTATALRYGVIYNDTPTSPLKPLIYLIDFGSDKAPTSENFTIQFDQTNGIFKMKQGT